MKCLAPMTVPNKRKTGDPFIKVPCGKCEACVMNRASQWYVRLLYQQRTSKDCVFVTLTYDDNNLPLRVTEDGVIVADVCRQDIRHYHARLRKALGERSKQVKYFLVSEYGPNPSNGWLHRPHYHAIYFNVSSNEYELINHAWKNGFVTFGQVTEGRIRYISGYVTEKLFSPPDVERVFAFISNGIGASYCQEYADFHSGRPDRMFVPINGRKEVLPRYYKERLYSKGLRDHFAELCEQRSQIAFENDLKRCGGDVAELFQRYHDIRANYVRKIRQKHKKKQNG